MMKATHTSEVLQHCASLGIGLRCLAKGGVSSFDDLKLNFARIAAAGEAAACAIGLVMAGSASGKAIGELLAYAHDTLHEKFLRACSLALASMVSVKGRKLSRLSPKCSRRKWMRVPWLARGESGRPS